MEKPRITYDGRMGMWYCQSAIISPGNYGNIAGWGLTPVAAFSEWEGRLEMYKSSSVPSEKSKPTFDAALKYTQTRHRSIIDRLRGK